MGAPVDPEATVSGDRPSEAEFEELLIRETARFSYYEISDLDERLRETIGAFSSFFGLDRAVFLERTPDGAIAPRLIWYADGIPEDVELVGLSVDERFPWLREELGQDELVRIHDFARLPAEAAAERAYAARHDLKSTLFVTVHTGGERLALFAFDAVRAPRSWDDELVRRLRIACELLGSALARERSEQQLRERLAFERFVRELSSSLAAATAEELDQLIAEALGRVASRFGSDRSVVFLFDEAPNFCVSHMWVEEPPGATVPTDLKFASTPWLERKCRADEIVSFSSLAELPPEAESERRHCEAAGIRSSLVIPLTVAGGAIGGLTFDVRKRTQHWPAAAVLQLRLLGPLIGAAVARSRAESARREALAAAALHREELAHVTRVATLGEMTSSIAHEVNQPLAAIGSNALAVLTMLESGKRDEQEIRETLQDIGSDVKRAGEVVHSLRALVKKGEREWRPVQLNDVVRHVQQLTRSDALLQGVELSLELASDLPALRGDGVQLQQVVLNIVHNSCESMANAPPERRRVRVSTSADGSDAVLVSIVDEGSGLEAEVFARLFEPFFTTKDRGLGMGLAISRSIVEAHGGRIWAEPNQDQGLSVQVRLPAFA